MSEYAKNDGHKFSCLLSSSALVINNGVHVRVIYTGVISADSMHAPCGCGILPVRYQIDIRTGTAKLLEKFIISDNDLHVVLASCRAGLP